MLTASYDAPSLTLMTDRFIVLELGVTGGVIDELVW